MKRNQESKRVTNFKMYRFKEQPYIKKKYRRKQIFNKAQQLYSQAKIEIQITDQQKLFLSVFFFLQTFFKMKK